MFFVFLCPLTSSKINKNNLKECSWVSTFETLLPFPKGIDLLVTDIWDINKFAKATPEFYFFFLTSSGKTRSKI